MNADVTKSMSISAAGMEAQSLRLRVIAENLANQSTTGSAPGADPYRRKTIAFENQLDRATGLETVKVKEIGTDKGELPRRYEPGNPAADDQGYVKLPNVDSFIEMMDMREAERTYNANLAAMQASRSMLNRTIELLK